VSIKSQKYVVMSVWLIIAGCNGRSMPTSPDARLNSSATPITQDANAASANQTWSSSSSSGGTVKETLSGPAIDGVVPEGIAIADQSNFLSGGSTILSVQVKKINLSDGTVLGVTLDFMPIGSITLAGGQGSMSANLGHFGVSRDQVRVKNGDVTILQGGFFQ
jgi:hypothetical protein